MKKSGKILLSSLLCALMPLSLLSCGVTPAETTAAETTAAETTEAETETEPVTEAETETDTETETEAEPQDPAGKVEVYQFAPENSSLMMSYVIITPNKKVVVIDGGIDGTGAEAKPYIHNAIRAALGIGENDYFEVEAWFLSHEHRDHYYELAKLLNAYTAESNYKINNFYFDFPNIGVEWKSAAGASDHDVERFNKLKKGFDNYYSINEFTGIKGADIPEDKFKAPEGAEYYYYDLINRAVISEAAVEKGLTISVDGVDFEVLMTWWKEAKYVNSTSVILRMTYKEHSILFLGDAAVDAGKRLLTMYPAERIKSEYVQMGHHGQGGPDKAFYDAIDTKNSKRLWPTPQWVWNNHTTYAIGDTRSWLDLPVDATEFKKQRLHDTGMDFVAGCYKRYASKGESFSKWTEKVLAAQRVAVFE